MRARRTWFFGLVAVLLGATMPQAAPPGAARADSPLEVVPCPQLAPPGVDISCELLTVAENRTTAESKSIKLAVDIVHARDPNSAEDPVLLLAGGPGEGLTRILPSLVAQGGPLDPLLADRTWIVLDQRGTGNSQPALDCPELTELSIPEQMTPVSDDDPMPGRVAAMRACRDRLLASGVDLTAYNTVESSADVADLRSALGLKSYDVYSESYGTRLALAVIRDHPDGVRSLVLDASYPLQAGLNADVAANYSRALKLVFDKCAADPACAAAYPDLQSTFDDLIARANADPSIINITNYRSGDPVGVAVDGKLLTSLFFNILYTPNGIRALPAIISLFAQGHFEILTLALSLSTAADLPLSWGMHFAVQCAEDVAPATDADPTQQAVLPQVAQDFVVPDEDRAICADWPVRTDGGLGRTPPHSNIPTLVLAGSYDPIIPPSYGHLAADTLSKATFVEFPGVGHTALLNGGRCSVRIVQAFLREPDKSPDASCAVGVQIQFLTNPPG
ncbi:MAG: alpha/beta fold hydrolase [Chloroflexi bacterium]|nr:alpha/beta fold hydrolase [Chloroflexota bacterium]